jgi:cytochrome c556
MVRGPAAAGTGRGRREALEEYLATAAIVAVGISAVVLAQAKTDEDYDKLMKGVSAAMGHAAAVTKAAGAGNADEIATHQKQLAGVCQTCHTKYREKAETGYAIKKG